MSALSSKLEAILYLKGQPLPLARLAEYAGCDRQTTEQGLIELMNDYGHRDSALEVVETSEGYCLQLRREYQDLVHSLIPVDLGLGALRTLAAIALKTPLTLTELVDLRGSGAYQHVQELVEQGFVKKRRKSDSRSASLHVTDKFHQYFQVEKLPKISIKAQVVEADATEPVEEPEDEPESA
ncbi:MULTISPECIES: SMC-Scp complex subunit ScpB [unclassified Leptolyngbya]|uniref:SMC-Scp complex subunit ScpB n=1 Tax=unclassified Leptolyngbya TaxID=2650499 RepID=UPI0016821E81|nr:MULTISPECIES: SMC-Scp complex subunit ScpB [unclassified Leptolyngbya]MBD1910094.1 SMC-Scp complex subunit ScpB [Leptolyngbya sp. FACHB-8]MBD2156866.1 SMC-Scp complex subunit ScpB [Leptolyngbya sp. FACHB-16]